LTSEEGKAFLYNIANGQVAGPVPLCGKPTALKFFDAFENTFFIGAECKSLGGFNYAFNIMLSNQSLMKENAHND